MAQKVFSLLALLLSILVVVLFYLGRSRMREGERLNPLQERISCVVPSNLPDSDEDITAMKAGIRALGGSVDGSPAGPDVKAADHAGDARMESAAEKALAAQLGELRSAVEGLQRNLFVDPAAHAIAWRRIQAKKFDQFARRELEGKLGLKGTSFETAKNILLNEYYRVQGHTTSEVTDIRRSTDRLINRQLYRRDSSGYQKYLDWRKEREMERRKRR